MIYVFIFRLLKGRETIVEVSICVLKLVCKTIISFFIDIKAF